MKEDTLVEASLMLLRDFSIEELLSMTPDLIIELASLDGEEINSVPSNYESKIAANQLAARLIAIITRRYVLAVDKADISQNSAVKAS